MIVFRVTLTAGSSHSAYASGVAMDAVCMVAERDLEAARKRACDRLAELGWFEAAFRDSVRLRENPDISGFNDVMRQAYADAIRLGVSVIEFPPAASAN